jgi:hypothetical protein
VHRAGGAGALSPVLFGRLGDALGLSVALCTLAALLLLTLPLAWRVQKSLCATLGCP